MASHSLDTNQDHTTCHQRVPVAYLRLRQWFAGQCSHLLRSGFQQSRVVVMRSTRWYSSTGKEIDVRSSFAGHLGLCHY